MGSVDAELSVTIETVKGNVYVFRKDSVKIVWCSRYEMAHCESRRKRLDTLIPTFPLPAAPPISAWHCSLIHPSSSSGTDGTLRSPLTENP
ncbi:hypothetical protein J6590_006104, partial [Homalodisca vitripennis]